MVYSQICHSCPYMVNYYKIILLQISTHRFAMRLAVRL